VKTAVIEKLSPLWDLRLKRVCYKMGNSANIVLLKHKSVKITTVDVGSLEVGSFLTLHLLEFELLSARDNIVKHCAKYKMYVCESTLLQDLLHAGTNEAALKQLAASFVSTKYVDWFNNQLVMPLLCQDGTWALIYVVNLHGNTQSTVPQLQGKRTQASREPLGHVLNQSARYRVDF
jgi:hypothetical protein